MLSEDGVGTPTGERQVETAWPPLNRQLQGEGGGGSVDVSV